MRNYNLLSIQREIETTEKEFEKFENTITDIDNFVIWLETKTKLYKFVKYKILEHPFVSSFIATYVNVKNITELITYNSLAEKALIEFNEINLLKENEIINWIIKYENNPLLIPIGYEETENWKTTNFILFKNSEDIFQENHKIYDNIIVDIKGYTNSLEFRNIYEQYSTIYLDKYYPTKEIFKTYGSFGLELSEYLSARNLYPKILKKHNIKPKEKYKKLLPTINKNNNG